jgi:hypothetical protein
MAWNGSGVFNRLYNWVTDKANGVKITASRMDGEFDNYKTGLENCLTRDGQNSPTANLPMNGKRHTGVSNATASDQYATKGQLDALQTVTSVAGSAPYDVHTNFPNGDFEMWFGTVDTGSAGTGIANVTIPLVQAGTIVYLSAFVYSAVARYDVRYAITGLDTIQIRTFDPDGVPENQTVKYFVIAY